MNQVLGPFISAIAIGFCVAVALGHGISLLYRRALAPKPASRPSKRAAAEVDDPYLQVAAWGLPPGARERMSTVGSRVVEQVAERTAGRRGESSAPLREPILEHDPRIRPESRIGGIGARGKPLPTPRTPA